MNKFNLSPSQFVVHLLSQMKTVEECHFLLTNVLSDDITTVMNSYWIDSVSKKKGFTKDKKKKLPNKNTKRIFSPNNYYNSIAGQPRGNHLAGQPLKYSNEQVLKIFLELMVILRKNMNLKKIIILHG